jgi:NADPH:quinone reductase-like Zn-dependent oxidoreductase
LYRINNQKRDTDMKALQIIKYGEIEDSLAFNEVSKPSVQAMILIEVKAAAINLIDKSIILEILTSYASHSIASTSV